jgi:hypothetical protein
MRRPDTSRTILFADFAGQQRRFCLPLGKIADLERLCESGIGGIMVRLGTHQFKARDIWETVRLGLEGGGMSGPEATATCMPYHAEPLIWYAELAAQILAAAVNGVPVEEGDKKKEKMPSENERPATSPTFTQPVAQ